MKFAITVLIYALLFAAPTVSAFAQEKPQPAKAPEAAAKTTTVEPTVDQILDKYVQSLGGRQALEKITSRVTKGTFEVSTMGLKGEIEIYAKAPNKSLRIQNLSGVGQILDGYDGKIGWSQNPMTGLREKSGEELAAIARASDIHASLKTRELYSKLESKGKEKVGNRETYVILATPATGAPVKMYFDTQTGLLLRELRYGNSPIGRVPTLIEYGDYRDVDGIKFPFRITYAWLDGRDSIMLDEINTNIPVDDAKFGRPVPVKR